jgi:hypothetical protein
MTQTILSINDLDRFWKMMSEMLNLPEQFLDAIHWIFV